jgi:uncharacterized SAM-binding protein YcdF (DUF218 family)
VAPPSRPREGGLLRRSILLTIILATIAASVYVFLEAGAYLTREDPLQKADVIFVLAGTRMVRPLEAADLYTEGYAPTIVMTRDTEEGPALRVVTGRGLVFLSDADRARELFVTMGIPRRAVLVPPRLHDSTAAEAITLRELAMQHGWRRVIVVTSRFHLARARFAVRRELGGGGPEIVMRSSRYDPLTPDRWWMRRAEIKWVVSEVPKLVAYFIGLGA